MILGYYIDAARRRRRARGVLSSMPMAVRARRYWLIGAALCLAGCLSPTLPLPPPSEPTVSGADADGNVRLTGNVLPESEVFALNESNNVISGQVTATGAYDFTIKAVQFDRITVWYVRETMQSPTIDVVVEKAPGAP